MPTAPAATPATIPVRFSARGAIRPVDSVAASRPSGHAATASPSHGPTRVAARHARADAGDDLVRDGVEARRPLGGGDLVVALAADQHDLVVDIGGGVAEIDE